jgi:hypothetical protein
MKKGLIPRELDITASGREGITYTLQGRICGDISVFSGKCEESALEEFPTPVQPGTDGTNGATNDLCDFFIAEPFNIGEHDDCLEHIVHRFDGPKDLISKQLIAGLADRIEWQHWFFPYVMRQMILFITEVRRFDFPLPIPVDVRILHDSA